VFHFLVCHGAETNVQPDTTAGEAGASVGRPVARAQPKKARRVRDPSRSAKSTRKSQRSLKVTGVRAQPGGHGKDTLTVAHPMNSFTCPAPLTFFLKLKPHLASFSLFSNFLAPSTPSPRDLCAATLLACLFCHPLDCFLAGARGCAQCAWCLCSFRWVCDCSVCLPAPECLDLAMEFSQTLYR